MIFRRALFASCLLLSYALAQTSSRISITVVDDSGVAVPDARVSLRPATGPVLRCQTGPAGMCTLEVQGPGPYGARVEKENYYALETANLLLESSAVEFTLLHQREVRETVDVVESRPAINPEQVVSRERLSGVDVINLPYPVTHDYRNALNYIPHVINDIYAQPHITGAETYQTLVLFDGFNVTQPANGQLLLRVSTDVFRAINVETTRISAQYGKDSGGVLDLNTASGDDHFRFSATDFIPTVQTKKRLALDKVNPRFTFSGPLEKGRAWFLNAADLEYDNIIIPELPVGSDDDIYWRVGDLFKVQGNVTPQNILTTSFNYNLSHDQHFGISAQNPPDTTPAVTEQMFQISLKDQHSFGDGYLVETGFGFNRYDTDQIPRGTAPYYINPDTAVGNYYFTAHTQANRWQLYSNLFLKPRDWHGNHQLKFGVDLDYLLYDFNFYRLPITYLNTTSTPTSQCPTGPGIPSGCARFSDFSRPASSQPHNYEASAYAQDRWLITNRFLLEPGLRVDWDKIVADFLFSPRLAATYVLSEAANTKISAGIGIYHDATPIFLFARPDAGTRTDLFYDPNGMLKGGPTLSTYSINRSTLEAPRYVNWSIGLEQRLPWQIYLKTEFIQKRGVNGFAYNWLNPIPLAGTGAYNAQFELQNKRDDHFDSFQVNLRRVFEKGHSIMGSYIRSSSHSSQVLDFNVDNPVFSTQQPGPYPWDAPNRFLSWGYLPLIKGFDFAYSMEYRTGFPFYLVDNQQQLAPAPGGSTVPAFMRFPDYFVLNPFIEKRFRAFGFYWAIRGGFDNITGRKNYGIVNNNVDSPEFLSFSGYEGRGFTGRIRFLGRK
jgi:hypothetical protein